jgi:hypothetical protein
VRTFPKELGEFRRMVNTHGAVLRTKSRDELIAAGLRPSETWDVAGRPATVTVIVEPKDDGSLRVVVQGFMRSKWLSSLRSVALDGFYHRPSGAIEPMPDGEFYEFD